ncbi:MAG: hypothetical protein QM500_02875 [Methylococcales bacterium]
MSLLDWDKIGDSLTNGISRSIDSETVAVPTVNDDRTFRTVDSGTPTVEAGTSGASFIKNNTNKMLIGGGALLLVVVLFLKK